MSVSFYIIKDGDILHEPYVTTIDGETFEQNALEVNMHNAGAADIARVLGFDLFNVGGSAVGEMRDLATFERRCLDTLSLLRVAPSLDSGRITTVSGGPGTGSARVVECARPDGYLTRNIEALRKLAARALLEGGRLVWA